MCCPSLAEQASEPLHACRSFPRARAARALGLLAALVAAGAPAPAGAVIGGDPGVAIYTPKANQSISGDPSLAISAAGVQFAAFTRTTNFVHDKIVVLRSDNGGSSWTEWSVITGGPGADFSDCELAVAAGFLNEWVYVSYVESGKTIKLASTLATAATASWTTQTVEWLAGINTLPRASSPALATRASTVGPVVVGIAYWVETATFDWELHYSVSLNGGAAFQPAVVPLNQGAPANGPYFLGLDLALGGTGTVHLALQRGHTGTSPDVWKLNYLSAVNNGALLADWSATVTVLDSVTSNTAFAVGGATIAADPNGNDVVVGYKRIVDPDKGAKILGSANGGVSWSLATVEGARDLGTLRLFWTALGVRATGIDTQEDGFVLLRPSGGILGVYEEELFLRSEWLTSGAASLATDPTHANQCAIVGALQFDPRQETALWFNAEWRAAAGYGVLETDGLHGLGGSATRFTSPPAVGDLDNDGLAEIVAPTTLGMLFEWDAVGSVVHSCPIGSASAASVPVLFDLDGDGDREVVVGAPDGTVHVLDGLLVPINPSPYRLGNAGDVYVSAGPVTGWSAGEIVAVSGDQVHVLNLMGSELPGWPQSAPAGSLAVGRAAIGDVDNDGEVEVVAAFDRGVVIIGGDGVIERQIAGAIPAPSGGVAMADLDGNGDLEIAIPRSNGSVSLLHHDGTVYQAGWPFVTGTGSPVLGVSIASVLDPISPALCFSTQSGSVFALRPDATSLPNYPVSLAVGDSASCEPVIARVARPGTARPQLLVGSRQGWLHEWTGSAETPVDWPHRYTANPVLSPVVADVDNDNIAELVVTCDALILVLDTGTAPLTDPVRTWRMTGHDLARSGCADCLPDTPTATPPEGPGAEGPAGAALRIEFAGAMPNPAPGRAVFSFSLPTAATVDLALFDLRGRRVRGLGERELPVGAHQIDWDGRDDRGSAVASGSYFARLTVTRGAVQNVLVRALAVAR